MEQRDTHGMSHPPMKMPAWRHRGTRGFAILALALFVLVSCSSESSDSEDAYAVTESTD